MIKKSDDNFSQLKENVINVILNNKVILGISETFNKVLQFLQVGTNKAKLKQVGKNGILVVEDVKDMNGLYRFLGKAKEYQKKDV